MNLAGRWAAICLLCLAAFCDAQPLADRIPQDAVIYVGWSGSMNLGAGYAQSRLKGAIDASKLPELLSDSLPRLLENLGHQDQDMAEFMEVLRTIGGPVWRHPSALYFGGLDMADPNFPLPKLALICDAGDEAKAMIAEVQKIVAKNGQPPIPFRFEEQDGLVALVIGNCEVSVKKKPAVAINARKEFKNALSQLGKDPAAMAYYDNEALIDQIDQVLRGFAGIEAFQKWATVRDAIGLSSLKQVAWSGGFDGRDWATHTLLEAPQPRAGFVRWLIESKPLSTEVLKAIPKTATYVSAGHIDAAGFLTELKAGVKKIHPDEYANFEQGFEQIKQAIGLDLQTDLLEPLGDEWAVYFDPHSGGEGLLGLSMIHRPKDAAKLEKSLVHLEQMVNELSAQQQQREKVSIHFRTSKQGDLNIHYLGVPAIAPAWAIKDGYLAIAFYPQVVSAAFDQVAGKGESIQDNDAFAALQKRLGGQSVTGVSYTDLPRVTADGYQEVLMLTRSWLGAADLLGAKTPPPVLPPLSKLLPQVAPSSGISWTDGHGWHSKTVSPFPGSDLLATGGLGALLTVEQAFMVGAIVPDMVRAHALVKQAESGRRLNSIGKALLIHAADNKGIFPRSLGELLLTGDLDPAVFLSPTEERPPAARNREELATWVNEHTDIVYLAAGLKEPAGAARVMAHEKILPDSAGVHVLFGDGRVEWLSVEQARRAITAPAIKQ